MLNSNSLRKLDMQDLMVFVAVYEQNSVTGVSETLCVSQSRHRVMTNCPEARMMMGSHLRMGAGRRHPRTWGAA